MSSNLDRVVLRFVQLILDRPKTVIALALTLVLICGAFLPTIVVDTSIEGFVPAETPALIQRNQLREVFGLADPMVVAVVASGPDGVFTPDTLARVNRISERVRQIPGVDPDQVTSLASEKSIAASPDGLVIERFLDTLPQTAEDARRVREAVMSIPLYVGTLVSKDATATLIAVELLKDAPGEPIYQQLLAIARDEQTSGVETYVAGQGAVDGYLHVYVQGDVRRLNPFAFVMVWFLLLFAFRTPRGIAIPTMVIGASIVISLGVMAALGIPYYTTTGSLTTMLVAIGVADGVHILGHYYRAVAERPGASSRELVQDAVMEVWVPVTTTTLTNMLGFVSIAISGILPPLKALGGLASLGIAVAWLFTMVVLPAVLVLLRPRQSRAFSARGTEAPRVDFFGKLMSAIGLPCARRPRLMLAACGVWLAIGFAGLWQVQFDDDLLGNFASSDSLIVANRKLNSTFSGTMYLDVTFESEAEEAVLRPDGLRQIEAFQRFVGTLPNVGGSVSIVDYVKQINRALNDDDPAAYAIPDDPDLITQSVLLYTAGAGPTDLEEEMTPDSRKANVRVMLNDSTWHTTTRVVQRVEDYLSQQGPDAPLLAKVSGRAALDAARADFVRSGHFTGVLISGLSEFVLLLLIYRSFAAAALATGMVAMSGLAIYAIMGWGDIRMATVNSISVSIAFGVAVDFSIHTLDRMTYFIRERGMSMEEALVNFFPSTGRAVLFNFLTVALGFSVLMASVSPRLREFGMLIAACMAGSFLASMTLLPALLNLTRPRFLGGQAVPTHSDDTLAEQLDPGGTRSLAHHR